MFKILENLPSGFGERLKEERNRLGLNQEDFGAKVDIQRVTQYQYEAEINSPTVRYLASAHAIGVDLTYILFGVRVDQMALSQSEMETIEKKVFELLDQSESSLGEKLSPEKRYVMFNLMRSHLIQSTLNEPPPVRKMRN